MPNSQRQDAAMELVGDRHPCCYRMQTMVLAIVDLDDVCRPDCQHEVAPFVVGQSKSHTCTALFCFMNTLPYCPLHGPVIAQIDLAQETKAG